MKITKTIGEKLKKLKSQVPEKAEQTFESLKETGKETIELSKEFVAGAADKIDQVRLNLKTKFEADRLQAELKTLYIELGKSAPARSRWRKWDQERLAEHQKELETIAALEEQLAEKINLLASTEPDESVKKFSEELIKAGYNIDSVQVQSSSPLINKKLKEIKLPGELLIISITRGAEVLIPDGNTLFKEGDQITYIANPEDQKKFLHDFKLMERNEE